MPGVEIADRTGYTVVQISRVRRRFAEHGLGGLQDRPRSGRPPTITARKRAQIVAWTLKPPAPGLTHWSTRDLARKAGVSHGTVHGIWRAHALKPHRVLTFKFTTDPEAEDKIYDVVGLYLNPPTHAVVLSLDEKTQIQALSRTQPLLPLRPGLPARQTHDYRRNGLTSLYAALEVSSGRVFGDCAPRHTGPISCASSRGWRGATAAANCTSSSITRPRIRRRRCRPGSPSIRRSSFTSPPRAPPGSTWSRPGSASSLASRFAVARSTPSALWSGISRATSPSGIAIQPRSCGRKTQPSSSGRPSAVVVNITYRTEH